jgi:excisionase family DNA binding protein
LGAVFNNYGQHRMISTHINPDERIAFRINDAVRASGIGRTKLYALMKSGTLSTVKIGGRRLILRDALAALLQKSAA